MSFALLVLISAAAPDQARYVMSVGALPVGVVSYSVEGSRVVYRSTQVFRSKQAETVVRLDLARRPEVWWLSKTRPDGCVEATEERTGQPEQVCTRAGGGTIAGRPFTSAYDASGRLTWLELSGVRFEASTQALPSRADPFAEGFELSGSGPALRVEPAAKGVEQVKVTGVNVVADDDASCLELARAYSAKTQDAQVVLGVVIEGGRAWPHAWVKTARGAHLDPTISSAEPTRRRYLAFNADAGRLYLELLSGQRKLMSAQH